jgi:DNA-binding HxlR family transcriptional regulator
LVTRTVFPVVPPKVEYSLSEMGASLMKTATRLFAWVDDHRSEISEARAEYDARIVAS